MGVASKERAISDMIVLRSFRSSEWTFTLISSCASSAILSSFKTDLLSPLSPMVTTGLRWWAFALSSRLIFSARGFNVVPEFVRIKDGIVNSMY